jgi:hypothetical protein
MVGNREADIYELFQKANSLGEHLLIRAIQNCKITTNITFLLDQVCNVPERGQCLVEIPRKPEHNLAQRQAKLSIRYCPVNVCSPHISSESIKLYSEFQTVVTPNKSFDPYKHQALKISPKVSSFKANSRLLPYPASPPIHPYLRPSSRECCTISNAIVSLVLKIRLFSGTLASLRQLPSEVHSEVSINEHRQSCDFRH